MLQNSTKSQDRDENLECNSGRRLFVGGLAPDVTAADLRRRFAPFGEVLCVDLILDKCAMMGESPCRGFAFVELRVSDDVKLGRCISTLNRCTWRGREMVVARAQPSYMERMRREGLLLGECTT
ncbi:Nucleotide-binding, alpha-beta plait [Ostreococcus tauri]|uniref:Nucleotide-binding, alpha-beta plait n=1 Tax=Ostreococcus tauri TaxID=70448 RepID=Q01F36_OSTTA|nr:Nucleotide-binding, alpha-beta plait [Ostreococcus tauri]CAL52065.1 Nucleotide-binding, alpha-beta plait [Ostreococcus tauri]|eukprot:XP_003074807.1 Nucleotide-binding, alpha-beta plait [Ostreococcus tauri]